MLRKQIVALLLVLVVLAGLVFTLASEKADKTEREPKIPGVKTSINDMLSKFLEASDSIDFIKSDGKSYAVPVIEAMETAKDFPEAEGLPVVGDRATLLKLLLERGALFDNSAWKKDSRYGEWNDDSLPMPAPEAPAAAPAPADAAGAGNEIALSEPESHSQTNEQVAGVSEGDIVKTDGKYIYAMSPYSNSLRIIKADGAVLEVTSTINFDKLWGTEFYLIGNDRLAIVGGEAVSLPVPLPENDLPLADSIVPEPGYYNWYGSSFTVLAIYDISDRTNPVESRRVSMEGWSVSTRVIDNVVYLVTNKYIWGVPYDHADSHLILPHCKDTNDNEEYEPVGFDRIYYVPGTDDSSYLLVGAVDVYSDEPFEANAYLGAGSSLYMSRNAIYVTQTRWIQTPAARGANDRDDRIDIWSPGRIMTEIMHFAVNGTDITYTGKGVVDGSPINQYSMDEYKGYFRIATTEWSEGTYVTVLNAADMKTVGRTEPLAPGEQMQSMRFMGDMGYVVTFENVDPLFTIDLSDPYKPKMLGELKIPGFSQYLHPVGDGLLLGIGRDTQEIYTRDARGVETVVGFRDVGMKASLFDVSDPYDPKEIDVLLLGEGWTEVSHNPRALMCDPSRNLYGFFVENWNNKGVWAYGATLLRVENKRITVAATLGQSERLSSHGSRLCFIGDTLYAVHSSGIVSYNYSSFARTGSIMF